MNKADDGVARGFATGNRQVGTILHHDLDRSKDIIQLNLNL